MAAESDNFACLSRCVALMQADRPLPADLAAWLLSALTAVVRGDDPGGVLGIAARRSERRPSTRARHQRRDAAIQSLFSLATGPQEHRAGLILDWSAGARRPPAKAQPLLVEIEATGLPIPDIRRLLQIAETSTAARCMTADGADATLEPVNEAATAAKGKQ